MSPLLHLAEYLLGAVVTLLWLRVLSTRTKRRLIRRVKDGEIRWGGQVRWRRSNQKWGSSGLLTMSPDGTLAWRPSPSSTKRGAKAADWGAEETELSLLRTRRDVSGLRYGEFRLVAHGRTVGTFGLFQEVGQRPA
jgi:hypothetical protein